MTPRPRTLLTLLSLIVLTGCLGRDPYARTDVWHPTGANAANLAAMVANPHDLMRGRGVSSIDTKSIALGIDRLQTDRPRPLSPSASAGGAGGGGAPAGGGSGGAGGAADAPLAIPAMSGL